MCLLGCTVWVAFITGEKNEAFKIYRKYKISTHPYMKKTDTSPRKTEL